VSVVVSSTVPMKSTARILVRVCSDLSEEEVMTRTSFRKADLSARVSSYHSV
jgi:hypothetical protein